MRRYGRRIAQVLAITLGVMAILCVSASVASAQLIGGVLDPITQPLTDTVDTVNNEIVAPVTGATTDTVDQVVQPVVETAAPVAPAVNVVSAPVVGITEPVAPVVQQIAAPVTEAVQPVVDTAANDVVPPVTGAINQVTVPVSDVVEPVAGTALPGVLSSVTSPATTAVNQAEPVSAALDGVLSGDNGILPPVTGIVNAQPVAPASELTTGLVKDHSYLLASLADQLVSPVTAPVVNIAKPILPVALAPLAATSQVLAPIVTPVMPVVQTTLVPVQPIVNQVVIVAEPVVAPVVEIAQPLAPEVEQVLTPVTPVVDNLLPPIVEITAPILPPVVDALDPLVTPVIPVLDPVSPVVDPVLPVVDPVLPVIDPILSAPELPVLSPAPTQPLLPVQHIPAPVVTDSPVLVAPIVVPAVNGSLSVPLGDSLPAASDALPLTQIITANDVLTTKTTATTTHAPGHDAGTVPIASAAPSGPVVPAPPAPQGGGGNGPLPGMLAMALVGGVALSEVSSRFRFLSFSLRIPSPISQTIPVPPG